MNLQEGRTHGSVHGGHKLFLPTDDMASTLHEVVGQPPTEEQKSRLMMDCGYQQSESVQFDIGETPKKRKRRARQPKPEAPGRRAAQLEPEGCAKASRRAAS